ncbi:PDZ domain-containing protein 11 isoform X2 [Strix uralensis]|uniref:PDZ domain-containing protein 11 isoform X2 n=1 Tax=Strix uralensis TaxID=36305 RepID=UPI003DA657B2
MMIIVVARGRSGRLRALSSSRDTGGGKGKGRAAEGAESFVGEAERSTIISGCGAAKAQGAPRVLEVRSPRRLAGRDGPNTEAPTPETGAAGRTLGPKRVTAFQCRCLSQLGFNIRGGKASQLGIFISKVIPDSDAHRAGLQEGDQVLSVNDVDFQDIEHSKAVEILKTAREITMRVRYFPYNYQRQKERTVH